MLDIFVNVITLPRMLHRSKEICISTQYSRPPRLRPALRQSPKASQLPAKLKGLSRLHLFGPAALTAVLVFGLALAPLSFHGAGLSISRASALEVFQKPMNLKPALGNPGKPIVLAMAFSEPGPKFSIRHGIKPLSRPAGKDDPNGPGSLPDIEVLQRFYWPTVKEMAKRYKIDPSLIMALIQVESTFNPDAVSNRGAMGLMQIIPSTAEHLGLVAPFDPEANIEAGVRYLSWLSKVFKRNERLILAAYNAGPTAVRKGSQASRAREVRQYIARVLKQRRYFKRRIARF